MYRWWLIIEIQLIMPKKQTTPQPSVTGAAPARVSKPAAPRVTSSKHKIATPSEPIELDQATDVIGVALAPVTPAVAKTAAVINRAVINEDPLDVISKLAYGYWEARGRHEGQALADWVRAEEEYRRRLA
jgi:hypothetical protein